jgi:hypothetical protein
MHPSAEPRLVASPAIIHGIPQEIAYAITLLYTDRNGTEKEADLCAVEARYLSQQYRNNREAMIEHIKAVALFGPESVESFIREKPYLRNPHFRPPEPKSFYGDSIPVDHIEKFAKDERRGGNRTRERAYLGVAKWLSEVSGKKIEVIEIVGLCDETLAYHRKHSSPRARFADQVTLGDKFGHRVTLDIVYWDIDPYPNQHNRLMLRTAMVRMVEGLDYVGRVNGYLKRLLGLDVLEQFYTGGAEACHSAYENLILGIVRGRSGFFKTTPFN